MKRSGQRMCNHLLIEPHCFQALELHVHLSVLPPVTVVATFILCVRNLSPSEVFLMKTWALSVIQHTPSIHKTCWREIRP